MKKISLLIVFCSICQIVNAQNSITLSPTSSNRLYVKHSNSGVTASSLATGVFESSGTNAISILGSTSATDLAVQFGTPTGNSVGAIGYNVSQNRMFLKVNNFSAVSINSQGNVGIGNLFTNPTAKLHVDGDFALKKKVSLSGNGGHLNFDRDGASVISVATPANGGGSETLNSIADGVDGMIVYVYPVQGTSITIVNEDAGSTAANRIITYTAANVTITNNGGCTLIYDGSAQRWRMISVAN